jgi:hypothetical protein
VPQGVDYQLHVSIEQHAKDSFLFAPQPVVENEQGNNGDQQLDTGTNPGLNFFTFFDPNIGNVDLDHNPVVPNGNRIDFTSPYVRIVGTGDFTYDVYSFQVSPSPQSITPLTPVQTTADISGVSNTTATFQDSSNYYTSVTYQLTGTVGAGDTWKFGVGYRDFTVTNGTSLLDVANKFKVAIDAAITAGFLPSGYLAGGSANGYAVTVTDNGTTVSLKIDNGLGFTQEGDSGPDGLVHYVATAATVTRTTTALDSTATAISFASVAINLSTTGFNSADGWSVTVNGTTKTATAGLASLNLVAADLRSQLGVLLGVGNVGGSGSIITITLATGVTVAVSTTGADPEGEATISGTPLGQPVSDTSTVPQIELVNWTTVDIALAARPTSTRPVDVGQRRRLQESHGHGSRYARHHRGGPRHGVQRQFRLHGRSAANVITVSFTGSGKVKFKIAPAVTSGTLTSTAVNALAVLDVTTLTGASTANTGWVLQLTGISNYSQAGQGSIDATAAQLVLQVNADTLTTGYTAEYDTTTNKLVIRKASAFTATLTETYDSATASGTLASAALSVDIDLAGLNGNSANVTEWRLLLPGFAAPFVQAAQASLALTGAAFANQFNTDADGTYSATYTGTILKVIRTTNIPAGTYTVRELATRVVTGTSQAATIITLGGTSAEGETWQVNLPSETPATYLVGTGANASVSAIIAPALNTAIDGTVTYASFLHNGKIVVLGTSAATTAINVPAVNGTGTVSGAVDLNWDLVVTPVTADTTHYPAANSFTVGDIWTFSLNGATVTYTVVAADVTGGSSFANITAFLIDLLNTQAGIDAVAGSAAGTIRAFTTSGATIRLGDFTWTQNKPHNVTASTADPASVAGREHYFQVLFELPGTRGAASFEAVQAGQAYQVTLNGQTFEYVVETFPIGTATSPTLERNFNTVAIKLAAKINASSKWGAVAVQATVDGQKPTIRIYDKQATSIAGDKNGPDPFLFSAQRSGDVHIVADIDNARLITGSFEMFTGWEERPVFEFLGITIYGTVPVFETVHYTISPRLELIDMATGDLVAPDAYAQYGFNPTIGVDPGSLSQFDPLLDYTISGSTGTHRYGIRVSSVITYDKFVPQYMYPFVYGGQDYELNISVPGHATNAAALELKGQTLQVMEGPGAGQAGKDRRLRPGNEGLLPVGGRRQLRQLDSRDCLQQPLRHHLAHVAAAALGLAGDFLQQRLPARQADHRFLERGADQAAHRERGHQRHADGHAHL